MNGGWAFWLVGFLFGMWQRQRAQQAIRELKEWKERKDEDDYRAALAWSSVAHTLRLRR